MRTLLAILAWGVMIFGVLGAVLSVVSIFVAASLRAEPSALIGYTVLSSVLNGLFRIVQSVAIGLGLLYLLDVDKRLRARAVAGEFA